MPEETVPNGWKRVLEGLPPVRRDFSFWSMTSTQFLGAFNDNLFKQLVLLLCTDIHLRSTGGMAGTDTYQALGFAVFSLPFVLFSGYAGYLSDLNSKRNVVILCKIAEIVVMAAGAVAFFAESITWLFVVLFFMGAQSAFFGPSKYGILPEMFRGRDLPYVNGVFIMTTFLAIVLGTALAGQLKESLGDERLWQTSLSCVMIAVLGTITSYGVRATPIANPDLRFRWSTLIIEDTTWKLIWKDRLIFDVLFVTSVFWMIGGVMQQAINAFGKYQLGIGDFRTSTMLVGVAVGIAIGCVIAGRWSGGRIRFGIAKLGNWGLVLTLIVLGVLGLMGPDRERMEPSAAVAVASVSASTSAVEELPPVTAYEWAARGLFVLTGVFAGFFTVPLQTFLQIRPPDEDKGRIIAIMNFSNFVGIFLGAGFYLIFSAIIAQLEMPQAIHFFACAATMAPFLLYRTKDPMVK